MLVLDTHAFIWAHKGIRIGKRTERRIAAAANEHELGRSVRPAKNGRLPRRWITLC